MDIIASDLSDLGSSDEGPIASIVRVLRDVIEEVKSLDKVVTQLSDIHP